MTGHTAGPWHVGTESGADLLRPEISILRDVTYVEGCRPTTYRIGSVVYPTTTGDTVGAEQRRANALLMAAAPEQHDELLACKQFLEDMHTQPAEWIVTESQKRHAAVCAAIAKATGAQS